MKSELINFKHCSFIGNPPSGFPTWFKWAIEVDKTKTVRFVQINEKGEIKSYNKEDEE